MKRKKFLKKLKYIIFFNFLDKKIEKMYLKSLHRKRDKYIRQALEKFKLNHNDVDQNHLDELEEKLNQEADRIYDIADKGILRANIKRAKLLFLATLLITVIIIAITAAATQGTALLVLPLITPAVTWLVSIASISVLYKERVVGSMDAILHAYEKAYDEEMKNKISTESSLFNQSTLSVLQHFHEEITGNERVILPLKKNLPEKNLPEKNLISPPLSSLLVAKQVQQESSHEQSSVMLKIQG